MFACSAQSPESRSGSVQYSQVLPGPCASLLPSLPFASPVSSHVSCFEIFGVMMRLKSGVLCDQHKEVWALYAPKRGFCISRLHCGEHKGWFWVWNKVTAQPFWCRGKPAINFWLCGYFWNSHLGDLTSLNPESAAFPVGFQLLKPKLKLPGGIARCKDVSLVIIYILSVRRG